MVLCVMIVKYICGICDNLLGQAIAAGVTQIYKC